MGLKKTATINGRIGPVLRARLDDIIERHGVTDTQMLEDALHALADYVEARKTYLRPMAMVHDEEKAAAWRAAAEERAAFAAQEPTSAIDELARQAAAAAKHKPPPAGKPRKASSGNASASS